MASHTQPERVPFVTMFVAVAAALIAGLVIGGYVVRFKEPPPRKSCPAMPEDPGARASNPNARFKVDISGRPYKGAEHAKVVIAEFSDYQCGYCRQIVKPLDQVAKKYAKDVKVVFMDFPLSFHRQAMPAAIAAYEVYRQRGNAAFWKFHDRVFANGRQITNQNLARWASEVGAQPSAVVSAVKNRTHEAFIRKAMEIGRNVGVRGTPTVFINGKRFRGRRTYAGFKRAIDREISKANKMIGRRGVTVQNYYAHLQKKALSRAATPSRAGGRAAAGAARRPPAGRRRPQQDPNAIYRMPVTGDEPFKGPAHAPVTIVEYSDYQCPFCQYAACVVNQIAKAFPRQVKIVFKNNPIERIHPQAMAAAQAALAAKAQQGNAGYWAMHDKIFPTQFCSDPLPGAREWLGKHRRQFKRPTNAQLQQYAKELGLDIARFNADMPKFKAQILREQRAALALGAGGTPAFFINGKLTSGIRPFNAFRSVIQRELAAAKKLMAEKKIPVQKLYNTIIARGSTKAVYLK